MIDWSEHQEEALRIAAEEIATRGMNGYLIRTTRRLREDLGLDVTKDALNSFLGRSDPEWSDLKRKAQEAYRTRDQDGGPDVSVTIEQVQPLPEDHPAVRDLERKIQATKTELRVERRKRKEADERATISDAIRGSIQANVAPWEPPVYQPSDKTGKWDVDMVVVLSDEHADREITPEQTMGIERFNFDVFRARAQRMVEVVEAFARNHLPLYNFERLWVLKLGDAINGDIHNMKHRNSFGNTIRAALATGDVEAEMISRWSQTFPEVEVISVPGNHPRTTSSKEPEDAHDNFDFVVASTIHQRLAENPRVKIRAPRSWGAFLDIRGWKCRMTHGDEVRSYRGFPWYGFDRREGRVKAMTERAHSVDPDNAPAFLDYMFYGHFHTPTKRSHAASRSIHNGAFYETDAYTSKDLAVGTIPEQTALVFRDRRADQGHVFEIPIYLRDREREEALIRGDWDPDLGRTTVLEEVG